MAEKVGIVVVHGIGSQNPGETLHSFVNGLRQAFTKASLIAEDGRKIADVDEIKSQHHKFIAIKENAWQVNVYEAHWADILSGEDVAKTFSKFLFEETTWFPIFNHQRSLWPKKLYSKRHVIKLTTSMAIIQVLAYYILELLSGFRKIRVDVLDNMLADVWNYTHSFKPRMLGKNSPISGKGEEIINVVNRAVAKAQLDGCTEIQIVAHSLGSVITHNALTQRKGDNSTILATPITYIYTIGSPLEKFMYIWPKMMRNNQSSAQINYNNKVVASAKKIKWYNFYSPVDLVSGKLVNYNQWGKVKNKLILGLGSSVGAHINYRSNPIFINTVACNLHNKAIKVKQVWHKQIWLNIKSFFIDCALPIIILLTFLLSLLMIAGLMWVLGWILGIIFYSLVGWWFFNPIIEFMFNVAPTFRQYANMYAWFAAGLSPLIIVFIIRDGYKRAKRKHSWFNDYELEEN